MSDPAFPGEPQPPSPHEAVPVEEEWQRLDPRMLLVHPVREVIRFLPPLLGLFIAGAASGGGGAWQLLGVLVPVVLGLLRYLTTSFRIVGGRVELRRGLLNRHVLSAPLDRVRTVDLTASLIHRALGLTTLRIGTGTSTATEGDELDLDGLPVDRARALRSDLLRAAGPTTYDDTSVPATVDADTPVVSLDLGWVRLAPLTSSGLVVAAGLLGAGSQVAGSLDLYDDVDPGSWSLGVPGWAVVAAAALGFGLVVSAISVAGYLVTNWDFRLTRSRGAWHLSRGLLTTRETSIDEVRVAGVSIAEPIGLRLAGGARLSAIVTGLSADAAGSSVLVPPAPRDVVSRVAGVVLGTTTAVAAPLVPHGPAARRRRFSRGVGPVVALVGLVALTVVLADARWWVLVPAVALLPLAVLVSADRAAALGHTLVDGYVVSRSGSLARRRDHLAVDDVIGWSFRATWFQRRVGLTSLVATTAGGRQSVTVQDVPEPLAVSLAGEALPHVVRQFLGDALAADDAPVDQRTGEPVDVARGGPGPVGWRGEDDGDDGRVVGGDEGSR
ncbi:PH domain-containing protein [Nocardioides sp.]|uniref:PH domain-containing protein n=1 Tax=Nocardioides sp. TaxID=35761 RepID=UPI00286A6E77|nr:PH domain-containing protein [Nocardioides sp.]